MINRLHYRVWHTHSGEMVALSSWVACQTMAHFGVINVNLLLRWLVCRFISKQMFSCNVYRCLIYLVSWVIARWRSFKWLNANLYAWDATWTIAYMHTYRYSHRDGSSTLPSLSRSILSTRHRLVSLLNWHLLLVSRECSRECLHSQMILIWFTCHAY